MPMPTPTSTTATTTTITDRKVTGNSTAYSCAKNGWMIGIFIFRQSRQVAISLSRTEYIGCHTSRSIKPFCCLKKSIIILFLMSIHESRISLTQHVRIANAINSVPPKANQYAVHDFSCQHTWYEMKFS